MTDTYVAFGGKMRKLVLTLVVALVGTVGTTATNTSANGATTIAITGNNSRSVEFTVTRQPAVAQYILVCAIGATECTPENAENSTKVVRFDCHANNNTHNTPHSCRDYTSTSVNHVYNPASTSPFFLFWRPNSPSNYSFLPSGTYNVVVFESADGTSGTYTRVDIEQFSFPEYSFTYDTEPRLSGDPVIGATLSISSVRWMPEPTTVTYQWIRCSTAVMKHQDFLRHDPIPYAIGLKGDTNVECYYINEDGTVKERAPEMGPMATSVRSLTNDGFQSYKLRDIDEGSFIAVHVIAETVTGEAQTFATASTSVIERKTAPVLQVAPTSTFSKTKKFKKLQAGARVSVTTGTWKWANTTTIQWYNCTKKQRSTTAVNAKQCKAIKRATKVNYKVKKTDQKRFLIAQVTATNELGSTVVYVNNLRKVI